MNIVKQAWENMSDTGAHLRPTKYFESEEKMKERFKRLLTDKIDVDGKTIIDYGCGGGYLGKHLEGFKIKQYIAFDIAEKSIKRAMENVKIRNSAFLRANVIPKIKDFKPDIFCSFACMIHFPTKDYLDDFLNTVNESGAKHLVLEIRNTGKGTKFREEPYKTYKDLIHACITEESYISKKLNNYKLTEKTDPKTAKTNCQILWYEIC
jgi:SAM-dependent methyltransferase